MTAMQAGILAFQNSFNEDASADSFATSRANYYQLLWSYYKSDAFEDAKFWGPYRSHFRLYRQTRLIYNPVRRLVDFYVSAVYPGVLSEDGSKLPEGIPLAIPLADDTPPDLKSAIAQFWQWTNWQSGKAVFVRYGAAFGSVLVEVVDDLERRKVTANIVRPDHVADLELDTAGNVRGYALQYLVVTPEGQRYTYRKEVDSFEFRYFKDGQPYDYGEGATAFNPYSFVPAVWAKHRDLGVDDGAPAIYGSLGKVRELNSLASHVHDRIHKDAEAPFVFWADGSVQSLTSGTRNQKRGATADEAVPEIDRESVLLLSGPAGGQSESLVSGLDLPAILSYVQGLLGEVEADHPELPMFRELRAMSQVTGPAAARLMGDVASMVNESQALYDQQSVKLFQMAVAIAGWRLNNGDWLETDRQREKFRPFSLDSYTRGDLDISIMPRPLIPLTERERIDAERARLSLEADRQVISGDPAGIATRISGAASAAVAALAG